MRRVTLYHLTRPRCLPLIEEHGLRTRADLSGRYGPPGVLDQVAPGTYAHGKRVSGWLSEDYARTTVAQFGGGLVSWTVDPAKTLAAPASSRGEEPDTAAGYWAAARPLRDWLADGDVPDDLEVHQNLPVRAKHVRLHAPILSDEDLGIYAPLVSAVADDDRLSAKALMHLAIVASDTDFDSEAFAAACALAWRDEPDAATLARELREVDPDKAASAALAEHGAQAPEAVAVLREALESTRQWADDNGLDHGSGVFARTSEILTVLHDE